MTLLYVTAGLATMSAIGLTSAYVMNETKKTEIQGEIINSVGQMHLLALRKSHSPILIRDALTGLGLNLTANSPLNRCLGGTGSGCLSFHMNSYANLPALSESVPASPAGNTISTQAQYKIDCPVAYACRSLNIQLVTNSSAFSAPRKSTLRIAGVYLSDRPRLAYGCAESMGQVITGLDFSNRRSICNGIPITAGCSGNPVKDLDAGSNPTCTEMVALTCANGLKQIGLTSGQGACL